MVEKPQITYLSVQGLKSLYQQTDITIRPLTILAGANSSGKSSIIQPLLLLKQTLESEYDTKSLIWDGSHVKVAEPYEFLNNGFYSEEDDIDNEFPDIKYHVFGFKIGINLDGDSFDNVILVMENLRSLPLATGFHYKGDLIVLRRDQKSPEIIELMGEETETLFDAISKLSTDKLEWRNHISRGLIQPAIYSQDEGLVSNLGDFNITVFPLATLKRLVQEVIHVPGLRGNPQRRYPVTTMDFSRFEGTFLPYTASVIHHWRQSEKEADKVLIKYLCFQLKSMNLTANISTRAVDNTQIEVRVGRTLQSTEDDTVSLADVGLGVSQVLPVLVALLVAKPGQLVYLEQPELHLHPRAQVALAQILADAANRGVRVVVETHSSLLLIGIQTLIAEGKLKPDDTILHWFTRGEDGRTTVDSQIPDENGAYGDWPEDFADVELDAQGAYLDAVARRQLTTEAGD